MPHRVLLLVAARRIEMEQRSLARFITVLTLLVMMNDVALLTKHRLRLILLF